MTKNRYWQLDARPEGEDFSSALSMHEEELAPLEDGEIRVRSRFLSMDAGTRMWMNAREGRRGGRGTAAIAAPSPPSFGGSNAISTIPRGGSREETPRKAGP